MGIIFFGQGSDARLPKIGVISYWHPSLNLYNRLPSNSLAVINPDNGIFAGLTRNLADNINDYQSIVTKAKKRNIDLLGYVPTGYLNHTCSINGKCQTLDRIDAQVKEYFRNFPELSGIFFDEVAQTPFNCSALPAEYQKLRNMVRKYKSSAKIAFNTAVSDPCVVAGLKSGEIIAVFENSLEKYSKRAGMIKATTQAAHEAGAIAWCLIYSVPNTRSLKSVIKSASNMNIDLFYATDIGGNWQAGENTWGSLPKYWDDQVKWLNPKQKGKKIF